jgi:Tfp pilus assembly protein PilV
MLIEVLISAVLVGLIVIATFNGFDVVTRVSADQRHHDQATLLAAQSQEQMRSDPATTLSALETTPHTYTRTLGGTEYKITQEAKPVGSSGASTGCNANEKTAQTGANIQITSSVTWPQLVASKRPAVTQASVVTPPTGSALEVDVTNGASTPAPVSGVTVTAKFIPVESESAAAAEATTGSAGCVVLTGIPATAATVEIAEKANFVTPSGALKVPAKEITIAPNITTHYPVTYNEGGKITAQFTYKGATTWEGQEVKSDTFAAFNTNMLATPEFEVGSTEFKYEAGGEERSTSLTSKYAAAATTPAGAKYPNGDLFPFPSAWPVNAGDCHNNGTASKEAVNEATVEPGKETLVKVPLSYVLLNVKTGTQAKPGALAATPYAITVTDVECAAAGIPNNAVAANLIHTQLSTTEGHLTVPFQPFGKYELCLYNEPSKRTYTASYTNTTATGSVVTIYPAEGSKAERETEEATAKNKRETEEATAKNKRETEEATAKNKRETEEAAARTQWSKERSEGKITSGERNAKLSAQTTARVAAESAEATKRSNAESAEATKRSNAEAAEATAKSNAEKEEAKRGYTVESGKTKC